MEDPFETIFFFKMKFETIFFFQNEVQIVPYKLVVVTYPLDHFRRVNLQTSGLVKKNQICSYNNNYITKD